MNTLLRALFALTILVGSLAAGPAFAAGCGDGVVDPGEDCDLGASNGASWNCCLSDCTLRPAGEVCRPSTIGVCDTPETCNGASDQCPDDAGPSQGSVGYASDPATGHCYLVFGNPTSWFGAESGCEAVGGYLAVPDSDAENTLIQSTTVGHLTWLGAQDFTQEAGSDDRGFFTVTGGNVTFSDFMPNEPNDNGGEDCVQYESTGAVWNDRGCGDNLRYVCELEPAHCGDRVVQTNLGETCDEGAGNGDLSSCCTADCQLEPSGTTCSSGGPCTVPTTCNGNADCPGSPSALPEFSRAGYDARTGHCYGRLATPRNWAGAEGACEILGGTLAIIDDGLENVFARDAAFGLSPAWIGFTDADSEAGTDPLLFKTATGEPIGYHAFSNGEPSQTGDQDCVLASDQRYTWEDLECSQVYLGICELATRATCPAAPSGACKSGGKGLLLMKSKDPSKQLLMWKWLAGAETTAAELGKPTGATAYRLCMYDSSDELVLESGVSGGGTCGDVPCWTEAGGGFAYKNASSTTGIGKLSLKPGADGKAKILAKAKGTLGLPTLPPAQPFSVQLHNSDGTCWGSTYSSPATIKGAELFKDTSDAP